MSKINLTGATEEPKPYEIPLPYADSVRPKPEAPSLLSRLKKLAEEENG